MNRNERELKADCIRGVPYRFVKWIKSSPVENFVHDVLDITFIPILCPTSERRTNTLKRFIVIRKMIPLRILLLEVSDEAGSEFFK